MKIPVKERLGRFFIGIPCLIISQEKAVKN